jgi:pyrroline-5-carboxylate reductase
VAIRSSTGKIAILGGGNIGSAVARGLVAASHSRAADVTITRRQAEPLAALAAEGFRVSTDNRAAVRDAAVVVLAVQPGQVLDLVRGIRAGIAPKRHLIVSVVSGVRCSDLLAGLPKGAEVVRAMPNTAIAIRESMTCLAGDGASPSALERARKIFDTVGKTLVIPEDLMVPATALCACGIAFFLRSVRAASQGGIEIGFHSDDALFLAAQTAKGAASLLLAADHHPEPEIDKVTTPRGCTIAGLNEMEHQGFSSALIKGIVTSADKAGRLFPGAGARKREE